MSLSYYGFFHISELQNLTKDDIVVDSENKRLRIMIRFSKTDQYGNGAETFVYDNKKEYSPYRLFELLQDYLPNLGSIVDRSGSALIHKNAPLHFEIDSLQSLISSCLQ